MITCKLFQSFSHSFIILFVKLTVLSTRKNTVLCTTKIYRSFHKNTMELHTRENGIINFIFHTKKLFVFFIHGILIRVVQFISFTMYLHIFINSNLLQEKKYETNNNYMLSTRNRISQKIQ